MQPTPKIRVSSDRILRVLLFVYFCRGLSGNTKERPTRRVYIEILTCRAIFYHLEDSRSHGNEREAKRAQGQGARPTPLGARPATVSNSDPFRGSRLSTKASRQSTLGYTHGSSLSVDGAQTTNSMVTQDTDKLFIQVRPPSWHNTYVLRLVVLIYVERIMCPRGVPCPSLYSPEGRVTDLETNPSQLQLP